MAINHRTDRWLNINLGLQKYLSEYMNTKESKTSSFVMINIIIGFSFLVCFSRFVQKISSLKHSVYRPPETYHRLERCKYTVSFDRISSVKKSDKSIRWCWSFFFFFFKKNIKLSNNDLPLQVRTHRKLPYRNRTNEFVLLVVWTGY